MRPTHGKEALVKIWVDDVRKPPDDSWVWLMTSKQTIAVLAQLKRSFTIPNEPPELMSLDHDLGGDDTTRPIVLWMCENEFWPDEVRVHSANPVGVEWLEGMIEKYKQ